jgi:hypothetical protein
LRLPLSLPIRDLWTVTIHHAQAPSMLPTSEPLSVLDGDQDGLGQNPDGSYDVYFAPKPPKGLENNWIQTIPGKNWFIMLGMPGPLEPWLKQMLRPAEVEPAGSWTS